MKNIRKEINMFVDKFGIDSLDNWSLKHKYLSVQAQVMLTRKVK